MRLDLVNPDNPVVSLNKVGWNRLNTYRVWKPVGLLVVAGPTPPDWEVTLIDENLGHPYYDRLPKPDLVGITAFTSQAPRAYEAAAMYRAMGVPVVIGGIQRHGICVVGSFIIGIDTDQRGIAETIAQAAREYGIGAANVLILTPLPGTKLYADMEREGRIRANDYPQDWKYYTLTYPVANYTHLTWAEVAEEVQRFNNRYYSHPQIFRRLLQLVRSTRNPGKFLLVLVANLRYRANHLLDRRLCAGRPGLGAPRAVGVGVEALPPPGDSARPCWRAS
jgi:hypothetical protein